MKKIVSILILLLSLGIVGCSNSSKLEEEDNISKIEGNIVEDEDTTQNNNLEYISGKLEEPVYNYFDSIFTIKNNTNETISTITLTINELDMEGNIIDTTYPQVPTKVKPGQNISISGTHKKDEVHSVELISFSYYDGNDEFVNGDFEEGIIVEK